MSSPDESDLPRAALLEALRQRLARSGDRLIEIWGAGDGSDDAPCRALVVRATLDGEPCVIKESLRLPLSDAPSPALSAEPEILTAAAGSNVVTLRRTFNLDRHELMVLELVPGTSLTTHLAAERLLPPLEALRVSVVVAGILAHLHERGIIYADLKPANLIYACPRVTLVDFSLAQRLPVGSRSLPARPATAGYVPPETAREGVCRFESDVFQLGLLIHQLLTGLSADGSGGARRLVADHPTLANAALRALLTETLDPTPERRPSAAEVAARLGEMTL